MKTTNQLKMMIAGVFLSFSIYSCKPSHVVTLLVDTDNISAQNVDNSCNFGQISTLSNMEFATYAAKGERIIWGAISTSSPGTHDVIINKIKYKQGAKILNKTELKGKKIVVGKVKRGSPGDEGYYSIEFTVFKNGVKDATYTLDPKIQVTSKKSLSME